MRALYLYFADTANPGRSGSSATADARPVDDGPLTPIQPGAFSRWMASRERAAVEAAQVRSAVDGLQLGRRPDRETAN
jgi:hypothetical protein